jgi:hypothetical protein
MALIYYLEDNQADIDLLLETIKEHEVVPYSCLCGFIKDTQLDAILGSLV